jgi:hypothetical protein
VARIVAQVRLKTTSYGSGNRGRDGERRTYGWSGGEEAAMRVCDGAAPPPAREASAAAWCPPT